MSQTTSRTIEQEIATMVEKHLFIKDKVEVLTNDFGSGEEPTYLIINNFTCRTEIDVGVICTNDCIEFEHVRINLKTKQIEMFDHTGLRLFEYIMTEEQAILVQKEYEKHNIFLK
jgi:hypothetical protein